MPAARSRFLSLAAVAALVLVGITCGKDATGPGSPTRPAPIVGDGNLPPVAAIADPDGDPATPIAGTEGGTVSFDGSGSSDPNAGDPLAYAWDFGDGSPTDHSAAPTHSYADDGTYTVTLTVTDDGGATGSATASVTVANAVPVVRVTNAPTTVYAGEPYALSVTVEDQGANDGPWAVAYDWGDGATSTASLATLDDTLTLSHTYSADGTRAIQITITDADGGAGTETTNVIVSSRPLVVDAGTGYTGVEGSPITFDGSKSNDPDGDPLTLTWDFGDGSAPGTGKTPSHAYVQNGSYTVTLTADDGHGHTNTATAGVTVSNALPVVNAGPDASVNAGQSLTLNGTFSDGGTADGPWPYTIDWGDGSANTTGSAASQGAITAAHPYATPGSYTATLTVTDKDGGRSSDALVVSVNAVNPVAVPGGAYNGTEGAAVVFDGSASSDPNGDALTYSWNFGDNTAAGAGAKPSHVYAQNGSYTVTLTVNDGNGHTASATTTATIANALPVVDAGPDAAIDEGQSFTLSGRFTDAGLSDSPWGYTINWGDNTSTTGSSATQTTITAAHPYNTPGTYTVTLTVKDKDNGGSSDALVLTVRAVKPTARAGGPYTGNEGETITLDGSASADPNGDVLTYSWNFGDNTALGTGPKPTHVYKDNGSYTVTLTVNDGNGHTATATTTATVANVAPVVDAGPDITIDEGQPMPAVTVNQAKFTDAGTVDNPWAYKIEWGDNSSKTGSVTAQGTLPSASKTYSGYGPYTVKVTVTDKNGAAGTDNAVVTIRQLWPTANAGGPYTGNEGSPITFNSTGSTDPNGDALTYAWDFNGDNVTDATTAAPSYTYNDGGSYTARLIVADPAGHKDTATAAVTVKNVVGTVNAGPDGTVTLGGTFTLNGSFTDSPSDGPWSYEIAWGDGSTTFGLASAPGPITASYKYPRTGTFTATVTLTANDGGSGSDAAVITVTTAQDPVAVVGGPYAGNEGALIAFSSAGSTDPNNQTLIYSWSFGDGTTSTAANPKKAYADNGTYTVTLTVKSQSGGSSTATTTATIVNVAPTASFGTPGSLTEGTAYTLSLNGSDVGTADRASLEYAFDCGQGEGWTAWSTTVKSVSCPALVDQATLTLQGQVRDKDGGTTAYTKSLRVSNAAPVVTLAATTPTSVEPGGVVGVQGSFTDKGVADGPWTYTIVWGDATPNTTGTVSSTADPIAATHAYEKPGTWSATLSVKDKDGATGTSNKIAIGVANTGPVANANGPYAGDEGALIAFSSAGSADPEGQTLTYSWSFGDGTTSTAANPKKAYADDGTYTVTLTVKDPSGASATSTATATVANVPPTATFGAPTSVLEGTSYTLTLSGTDVGTADRPTLEYAFDCGLGAGWTAWSATVKSVTCPGAPDQQAVTAQGRVRDKDGAATEYAKPVSVTNAAPAVAFAAATPTTVAPGATVGVEGTFTDKGSNDSPWTYTIVWGDGTANTVGTVSSADEPITASHVYTKPGTWSATLAVEDKDGASGTSPKVTVSVSNTPPVADANGPYAGNEGATIAFSSAGSADPEGQALTYSWSFGDGTSSTAANPNKVYADNGTYTVTLTVKDASGATATSTTTATVANVAPTASFGAPTTQEGTAYTLTLSGTDAGAADRATLEYSFDCGQGGGFGPWGAAKSATCPALPDQASLTVRGQVQDKDGGVTAYTKTLAVNNALPVVTFTATSPTTMTSGGTLDVQGSFTDKGSNDSPWTYTIVWGDGTPNTTGTVSSQSDPITASHAYTRVGTWSATLNVKDKDNGSATSTRITVVVQ